MGILGILGMMIGTGLVVSAGISGGPSSHIAIGLLILLTAPMPASEAFILSIRLDPEVMTEVMAESASGRTPADGREAERAC